MPDNRTIMLGDISITIETVRDKPFPGSTVSELCFAKATVGDKEGIWTFPPTGRTEDEVDAIFRRTIKRELDNLEGETNEIET